MNWDSLTQPRYRGRGPHSGIHENEWVDRQANKAREGRGSKVLERADIFRSK